MHLGVRYIFKGDIQGAGEVFWDALVLMVVSDPNEVVAMEAVKAMFGAPLPQSGSIKKRQVMVCYDESVH